MNKSNEHLTNVSDAVTESLSLLKNLRFAYEDLDQNVPSKLLWSIESLENAKEELQLLRDSLYDEQLVTISNFTKESLRTQLNLIDSCKNADPERLETLETLSPLLRSMFSL